MSEQKFARAKNEFELIRKFIEPGKQVLDIGCGRGSLVKLLRDAGYNAFGIDKNSLIKEAINKPGSRELRKRLFTGKAEKIPFEEGLFDYVIMFASFHHLTQDKTQKAFEECKRVLKHKGKMIIVEPYPLDGYYYELLKLAQDEKEIQKTAYKHLLKYAKQFFRKNSEKYFYMPRTIDDYKNLLNTYVKGLNKKNIIFKRAEKIIFKRNHLNLFKSTIRVSILSD
jgi:ubiquinone/menaquinone biosynthesis C-methylase UbiE